MLPPPSKTEPPAPPPASHPLVLSENDVERLLTEETPDARIEVVRKVAQGHAQDRYTLRELSVAEQIFRLLVRDTEVSVRAALADSLKENPRIPRDIILALSRDVDEVALPVIEESVVLSDSDLIALIQSARHNARPNAIAKRKQLSENVAMVLVATKDVKTIVQLMDNKSAAIDPQLYQQILRDFDSDRQIMDALAGRDGLPVTVVEKVITLVSDTIADSLRTRYNIASSTIAIETEKTRELVTLKLVEGNLGAREVEKLVEQLQVFGRLTPSIILTSLCRGNLYFFEVSLARLSSIPIRNAQLLIHDKGEKGFKALYTKAGLPEKFFAACKLLLQVVAEATQNGSKKSGDALAQSLLSKASGQNIENLAYILALIRQNG